MWAKKEFSINVLGLWESFLLQKLRNKMKYLKIRLLKQNIHIFSWTCQARSILLYKFLTYLSYEYTNISHISLYTPSIAPLSRSLHCFPFLITFSSQINFQYMSDHKNSQKHLLGLFRITIGEVFVRLVSFPLENWHYFVPFLWQLFAHKFVSLVRSLG